MTKKDYDAIEDVICPSNTLRVLASFYTGQEFQYTLSEIAEDTQLSRTAVRNALSILLKENKVVKRRRSKQRTYYQFNNGSLECQRIKKLFDEILAWKLKEIGDV